jgi:membrane-associated phospholipid phosphatase
LPSNKKYILNLYFLVPFLAWCIAGAGLLYCYDQYTLFSFVNGHYSDWSDTGMVWLSNMGEALFMSVLLVIVFILTPFRHRWFILGAVLCTAIPALITQGFKFYFAAPRPMTVYAQETWVRHLDSWPLLHANSFPSGHATGAFSLYCFLSLSMPARYRFLGALFFLLALGTGYARMYLAAHFFADVYAGSIIGTLVALLVFQLVRYLQDRYLYKRG